MKKVFLMFSLSALGASGLFAAETTMTGKISDSNCGASHAAATHGKKMSDRQCTQACIKGGAKYVFVSDGKVYSIANQNAAGLAKYAGEDVKLTGDVTGNTVTVAKLEKP